MTRIYLALIYILVDFSTPGSTFDIPASLSKKFGEVDSKLYLQGSPDHERFDLLIFLHHL